MDSPTRTDTSSNLLSIPDILAISILLELIQCAASEKNGGNLFI